MPPISGVLLANITINASRRISTPSSWIKTVAPRVKSPVV
jgi:hypothetical protein